MGHQPIDLTLEQLYQLRDRIRRGALEPADFAAGSAILADFIEEHKGQTGPFVLELDDDVEKHDSRGKDVDINATDVSQDDHGEVRGRSGS